MDLIHGGSEEGSEEGSTEDLRKAPALVDRT